MPDATAFAARTSRFGLPAIFPNQSQKEFFVNEAHALTDALLQTSVKGVSAAPPTTPSEGETWLAATSSSAGWSGFDDHICVHFGGSWHCIPPVEGMSVFDESSGVRKHYAGGWISAAEPTLPIGGTTVDSEARIALSELIEALRKIGIFPRN